MPIDITVGEDLKIPGLIVIEDFISEEEEKKLLEEINKNEWIGK